MQWSWKIARLAGINVYMHVTFLLLIAVVGFSGYSRRQDVNDALLSIALVLCLFGIIVLHELGHALAARRYGIKTRDIILLPIGGLARLERIPEKPAQELVVALAGPAVNVVMAVVLVAALWTTARFMPVDELMTGPGAAYDFLNALLSMNIWILLFNLVPAFPMAGGRVLRALLAMKLDYVRATQIAASIGQMLAMVFGVMALLGLFGSPMLALVALFVWMAAAQEAASVQTRYSLAGLPVQRGMIREFHTLDHGAALQDAVRHVLAGYQQDFPIMDGDRLVGLLTRADLMRGLAEVGPTAPVAEVMRREFEALDPFMMLDDGLQRLQASGGPVLPVIHDGRLVGLLTLENVSELLMIRQALDQAPPNPLGPRPQMGDSRTERPTV